MKRIFKGPLIWIVVAVVGVLIAMQFLISSGGGDEISASQMNEYIASGEVKDITFVDGDQVIKATLDDSVDRDGGREVTTKWLTGTQDDISRAVQRQVNDGHDREVDRRGLPPGPAQLVHLQLPADHPAGGAVPLADELHAGRRRPRGHAVRQVQGEADLQGHAQDDLRRRRRLRRGRRGARRDQGVPPGARQVPGRGRQDPQGRAAVRRARHRQDAARPCGGRRGRRAVLLDLRLRLRRDVRRCRRLPGPRPVRAGQGERPRDRLHRRDRRRRPAPRHRHGRRPRRARADPQPAAGRDGRLRRAWRRHPDRGHQPARRARPGAAAPGPLRPADPGGRARPGRPRADPHGARPRQAAGPGRQPDRRRASYARLQRRRPGQRAQRGRAAHRAHQPEDDHDGDPRRGHRPRDRRSAAAHPPDEREGEAHHRLPRGRPRPGRGGAAGQRPGAQGDDPAARSGARLHDGAAGLRQVLPAALADARPARLHAGRPGGRGDGLPRPDHRRRQRHREGHRRGPRDGHPVRHDRAAGRDQAGRRQRRAVPGPRHRPRPQLLRGGRRDRRRGDQEAPHHGPPGGLRHPRGEPRRPRLAGPRAARQGDPRQGADRAGLRPAAPSRRAAGVDRVARPASVDDPRGRDPRGDPRPCGRQRLRAPGVNGSSPDSDSEEGGVVVTPPGAGGDVHGVPPLGGAEPPTPPAPGSAGPT